MTKAIPDQEIFDFVQDSENPFVSQKGYAYVIQNWYDSQEGKGSVVDMEDENPQQQAVNGI